MAGRLVVLDRAGRAKSKSFALGSGMCTLGRSAACDIRVLLPDVSPHHASVTVHANQTVVRNVGSGTTLVNGASVSVCALQHGDELTLGGRRLRWEYDAPQGPRRNKTQPALALPPPPPRAARRGTLAAPPRPPDRDVQLALELRHRASMPASSGTGGKQVAIVQPQRRNTDSQNESASPRLVVAPHRADRAAAAEHPPAPEPAPRKSAASARLHTPTKATLWIESRRGRARSAPLRASASAGAGAATPLRLAVLRRALTPRPRAQDKLKVTKIQAPLHIDHTKRAAIMLMTGHTPKPKPPSPRSLNAPSFVAKKRSPATRTPRGRSTINATNSRSTLDAPNKSRNTPNKSRSPATPQTLGAETPEKSARKSNTRNSGKRSVSVLEITDSDSPLPNPRKSALKSSGQRSRKTESIKFDLSNLENQSDLLMVSSTNDATEDITLRYSSSPPSPSSRRSIHSRSSRMLETIGSPMRSAVSIKTVESPASPRSLKSARGSIIVQKALESSDTFVTESQYSRQTGSPRRRDLEAYSVVDLVSLDSDTSRSVYGSAGSPSRSGLLGSSTPLVNHTALTLTTPENPPRPQSTRVSRARSRSRLDDSTRTIDSVDDDSPKSSRKGKPAKRSLDDSLPESPQTYISLDSSRKSLGNLSTTAKRGSRSRLDNSDSLLESPKDIALVSMKQSLGRNLSDSKRVSRSLNVSISPSPKDISLASMKKSLGKKLSTSNRSSRLDDSTQIGSPTDETSPPSKKSQQLSTTKRGSRSLNNSASRSPMDVISPDSSINSLEETTTKRGSRSELDNSVSLESHKNTSNNSSRNSFRNALSNTIRSSRGTVNVSAISPNSTRKSSKRGYSIAESPKNVSATSSRKSLEKPSISKRGSRSKLSIVFSPKPVLSESPKDISANSTRNSVGQTTSSSKRASRSKVIDSLLSSPVANALANSTRKSTLQALSTSKRESRRLVDSLISAPKALADSTRKSVVRTPASSKRSRSQLIESINSSPNTSKVNALANSTRKSIGIGKTPGSKRGRSQLIESSSPSPSKTDALVNSTRKSVGKTPTSKRGSRSKLIDSVLFSSPIAHVLANSTRKSVGKTPSPSKRSQLIDSALSSPNSSKTGALVDSTRKSVGLSSSKRSRSQAFSHPEESVSVESPKHSDTSRKSRRTPSTSTRRTRSLPLESPKDTSLDSARKSRVSAITTSKRNTRGPNTSLPETPRNTSPAKSPKSPAKSPKSPNASSKSMTSRTLTISINRVDGNVSRDGEVTPEERGSPADVGTPVLSIRSLLDASVSDSPSEPPHKRGRLADKRKTFANARDAVRNARGSLRSKSLILTRDMGDTTPTGIAEPTPEAVKSKHSSAKKSRSRRSIIDTLDDSSLVKHLFNSPVKRKLSQSMSEFSRRLEEPETSPNVSGVNRLFTRKSPKNELKELHGVRSLLRTPRARRSIRNDLTDVRGVKAMFAAAPRDSLGDVRGVKRAFQASPNDELRRVSGVKDLFRSKKPRDDLTDVRGVRELFKRGQKDELNASGVKQGLQLRSPRNDLRDVRGVKKLFQQSKAQTSPNVSGVARLLDEPAPAEVMFDQLVGKPPVRATYSKTFIAHAKKPAKRRRTTSLSVPVDVLVNNVEDWLEKELQKRVSNKSVARALQKLATDTVAGGTPIISSRSRNSIAPRRSENYPEHTLPIKKRSLDKAPEPRSAKKRSLPLKKRVLVHSTPVKGRAFLRAADVTLARMSPIACEPALTIEEPVQGSPTISRDSPKKPKQKVIENSAKPSPKKAAKQTEEVSNNQRSTRARGGKKAASPKKATPKKAPAAKKAAVAKPPTPKKSPMPKKASTKVPTPTEVAPKEPTPKASRSRKVAVPTEVVTNSPAPKKATRSKKIPAPAKVTPKKSPAPKKTTRSKKVPTPKQAAAPKATRTKDVPTPTEVTPKKSPTPRKATRGRKILTPVKAVTPKKATVVVKKPRAVVANPSPKPTRGRKTLKTPAKSATKQSRAKVQSPVIAPVEKRSRKQAPKAVTPKKQAKKAIRVSLVLSKPSPILKPQPAARTKRSKNEKESPKKSPVRGKNPAAGDAPVTRPTRGRKTAPTPQKGRTKASVKTKKAVTPVSEKKAEAPKRGRRAPATEEKTPKRKPETPVTPEPKRKKTAEVEPKRGRKATLAKKDAKVVTPESKVSKAVPTPEPKGRGRKVASKVQEEPASKRGRKTSPQEQVKSPPPSRSRSAKTAVAPKEAAKPKGKKAVGAGGAWEGEGEGEGAVGAAEQRAPRGRKRKNDTTSVDHWSKRNLLPRSAAPPLPAAGVAGEGAPRGRKRKNDTTSVEKKKEPSPKKPRASRSAAPPSASSRARRR